jgi:hypothetical protein
VKHGAASMEKKGPKPAERLQTPVAIDELDIPLVREQPAPTDLCSRDCRCTCGVKSTGRAPSAPVSLCQKFVAGRERGAG